tara:strand:- start:1300 stop:1602 length:303 start_codon:yes stop_codon:yes gene_type:complete
LDRKRIFKSHPFLPNRVPDTAIGHYLKTKRLELDLGVRELGRQINIDATYLSSLERNKHGYIPSNKTLRKLSGALNIEFDLLKELRKPLIKSRMEKYEED